MLTTDQESLGSGSQAASPPPQLPVDGLLVAGTSLKEDWCDRCDSRGDDDGAATVQSYPLPLELSQHSEECDREPEDEEDDEYEGVAEASDGYSDVGEPGDTEVVFVKEGVNVWPSRSERFMGRLSLIKQHGVLFLAWLPYTPGSLLEDGSFQSAGSGGGGAAAEAAQQSMQSAKERTLYAVHPIPLSDIKAIHKHAPPLGHHKVVVTLFNGVSLAPLYFQQGGIKAFFSALREHAYLMRSADDPNTYLINDLADPLQRSLTSMELADVLIGAPPAGASATFPPASGPLAAEGWRDAEAEVPLRAQLADLVDRFSRGLQTAKDTASSFFATSIMPPFDDMLESEASSPTDGPAGGAGEGGEGRQAPRSRPPSKRTLPGLPPGADVAAAFSSSNPDLLSADAGGPGTGAGTGGAGSGDGQAAAAGGEEPPAATTELGVFEIIERSAGASSATALWTRARPPPLSLEELNTFCDREGRLVDEASFRQRVFVGGLEPEARPLGWKFLLGLFPPNTTWEERRAAEVAQLAQYRALRRQWTSISKEQAARFAKWRERKARIEKDVRRTDRGVKLYAKERGQGQELLRRLLLTYSIYNFDLGYVQGMSDLASPILHVMRSQLGASQLGEEESAGVESQAFWCFARLMDRMELNFSTDCTGMHAQLSALRRLVQLLDPPLYSHLEARDCLNFYFAYRWCLIHFKREFPFEDVMRLWEALWTGVPSLQLHLYCCVAVLEHHRRQILGEDLDFDGMLKFCVELSGKLDLPALLRDAELLCNYAGEAGRECVAGLPVLPHMVPAATAPAAGRAPPAAQ